MYLEEPVHLILRQLYKIQQRIVGSARRPDQFVQFELQLPRIAVLDSGHRPSDDNLQRATKGPGLGHRVVTVFGKARKPCTWSFRMLVLRWS